MIAVLSAKQLTLLMLAADYAAAATPANIEHHGNHPHPIFILVIPELSTFFMGAPPAFTGPPLARGTASPGL
jgi:hypothetical protein